MYAHPPVTLFYCTAAVIVNLDLVRQDDDEDVVAVEPPPAALSSAGSSNVNQELVDLTVD